MRTLKVLACMALIAAALLLGCSKDEAGGKASEEGSQLALGETADGAATAVTVNGKAVTNREVAQEEGRLMQQLGGRVDPQQMGEVRGMVRQQAMNNIISRMLLEGAIEEEGITVTPEEVETRLAEVRSSFGSEQEFSDRLAMMGMTEDLFVQEMGTAMKVDKLLDVRGKIQEVSEADLRSYYDENPARFNQQERVQASHILIKVEENDTEAEKEEKRREAEGLVTQLKAGGDFAELAKAHSWCPSKERGGDLGFFQRGQMVKPFEDAAFSLGVGELSDIVETQFGYHIIKVTAHEEPRSISFEEAKPGIAAFLEGQQKQQAMSALVEGLRAEATIEYPE